MSADVNNPYFRTRVLTAGPEELRLMLIEGAIRFLREGREALAAHDHERIYDRFTNARAIIVELMNSLRHEVDPELCARLDAVYNYILRLTIEGSFERDAKKIDEAVSLMEYDRETWVLLMEKAARQRAGGAPAPSPAAVGGAAAEHAASICLEG